MCSSSRLRFMFPCSPVLRPTTSLPPCTLYILVLELRSDANICGITLACLGAVICSLELACDLLCRVLPCRAVFRAWL
eukprot:1055787-Amphidinium_carterae.1